MKLTMELVERRLEEYRGELVAEFELEDVENLDEIEEIATKEGYDVWFDSNDNLITFTKQY